jgi:hypothetical protein
MRPEPTPDRATMSDFHSTPCEHQQSHALGPIEHESAASTDLPTAEWFCRTVHERAEAVATAAGIKHCWLVLSSFGELPPSNGHGTWENMQTCTKSFALGQYQAMAEQAINWAKERGRNVYLSMVLYRGSLGSNRRGKASEALGIFGFGADLDRDKGCEVRIEDLPLSPTAVIRSSSEPVENFNVLWLLDRLITFDEARPIAQALCEVVGDADRSTADATHVWRVPGTLNWPKKTKVARGRPPGPQFVHLRCESNAVKSYAPETVIDALEVALEDLPSRRGSSEPRGTERRDRSSLKRQPKRDDGPEWSGDHFDGNSRELDRVVDALSTYQLKTGEFGAKSRWLFANGSWVIRAAGNWPRRGPAVACWDG